MIAFDRLTWMRQRLLDLSEPTPEWWAFVRKHCIDLQTIIPDCGSLTIARCTAVDTIDGQYVFDFTADGVPCVVIEGLLIGKCGSARELLTLDIIAWPIHSPEHFASAMGPGAGVALLGPVAAFRVPSDNTPIKLYRNPESWLLNGCEGSVALKPEAAEWLNTSKVPLICEDVEHARCVSQMLGWDANKRDIFIPKIRRVA